MNSKVDRRGDVKAGEGERRQGNADIAEAADEQYPLNTPEQVRAAWSHINRKDNAAKFDPYEVRVIKNHIKRAAKKLGVEISES